MFVNLREKVSLFHGGETDSHAIEANPNTAGNVTFRGENVQRNKHTSSRSLKIHFPWGNHTRYTFCTTFSISICQYVEVSSVNLLTDRCLPEKSPGSRSLSHPNACHQSNKENHFLCWLGFERDTIRQWQSTLEKNWNVVYSIRSILNCIVSNPVQRSVREHLRILIISQPTCAILNNESKLSINEWEHVERESLSTSH